MHIYPSLLSFMSPKAQVQGQVTVCWVENPYIDRVDIVDKVDIDDKVYRVDRADKVDRVNKVECLPSLQR